MTSVEFMLKINSNRISMDRVKVTPFLIQDNKQVFHFTTLPHDFSSIEEAKQAIREKAMVLAPTTVGYNLFFDDGNPWSGVIIFGMN